jgi:hypothetical protein
VKLKPCALCGAQPHLSLGGYLGWEIICPKCYDGAPDAQYKTYFGRGVTEEGAVSDWNERTDDVRDAKEPP